MKKESTPLLFKPAEPDFDNNYFLAPVDKLISLANSNDSNAQLMLGICYLAGTNHCEYNETEGKKWIAQAASRKSNTPQSLCAQGFCYKLAVGGVNIKNLEKATEFFQKAANENFAPAKYELGNLLCKEEKRNISQTESDIPDIYGNYMIKTQHVNHERRKLFMKYFNECAEQNYPLAFNHLGYCYLEGFGVAKDVKEGFRLSKLAAEAGVAAGKYNLGWCYEMGYGVQENSSEARKWYQAALDQGHENARQRLKNLSCCTVI